MGVVPGSLQQRIRLLHRRHTQKIEAKDFLIVPISDGWHSMIQAGKWDEHIQQLKALGCTSETLAEFGFAPEQGDRSKRTHWSLIVVDCREPILKTRYFDSDAEDRHQGTLKAANLILSGLCGNLNYARPGCYNEDPDVHARNATIELRPPTQWTHNTCTRDKGASCGPFVYGIAKEMCQYIVECREDSQRLGTPVQIEIGLPEGFGERWAWDSGQTRAALRRVVEREMRSRVWLNGWERWFDERETGRRGWRGWLGDRGLGDRGLEVGRVWDSWSGEEGVRRWR
ncbi:hypothetical protein BDW02DRAFT_138893 [Decorospora gaudefroyi]|uniref:Ubiquitin-like protease family profile domain-containing protein n=1 Tax=Decorospora gaudefroyi TaxID=184978 RepID=A0A6A5K571_9PLEO|nr:hypothetical protein BDW02DRAFT_138893 [Decorospora gaudefroyi]